MNLHLTVENGTSRELNFTITKMINAGRTNRDIEDTKKHLEELRKGGANLSDEIPVFHPKIKDKITTGNEIEVLPGSRTSGEVEYVIMLQKDKVYIAVGSDHSDRELQKHSSGLSKQICPNIMSPTVWDYEEVKDNWDEMVMRSWVEENGERKLYQEDKLGTMMRPEEVIEETQSRVIGDLDGAVIYAGTFPTLSGDLSFTNRFEMEIADEDRGKKLHHVYHVNPITWFKKK